MLLDGKNSEPFFPDFFGTQAPIPKRTEKNTRIRLQTKVLSSIGRILVVG